MATELFPNGLAHYVAGGVLVGLGVAAIYLATGVIAGASSFLESTLSYVSGAERFARPEFRGTRDWRLAFALSIAAGAGVWTLLVAGEAFVTDVQWWRLLVGGTLVGVGTRLGKGCTSGHGVCGVGSRSATSVANVATFLGVAVVTALLVQAAGVTP